MFALLFGLFLLCMAFIFRDYASQDEAVGDLQGAQMDGIAALGLALLAMVFIVIGVVGA